jgi:hypothetical protein
MGAAAAALQRVTGKKFHGAADLPGAGAGLLGSGCGQEAKKVAQ